MTLQYCTEHQLPEILTIFNDTILNSTALYEYNPRTPEFLQAWWEEKQRNNFPVIGAFDENNALLGFAAYGKFRPQPAYKYTVEHSVYVRAESRGSGVGKALLRAIIAKAEDHGFHVITGVIDAENAVSIRLHESAGFEFCGSIRQAGYKFGRWLDVAFYQLILKAPEKPADD